MSAGHWPGLKAGDPGVSKQPRPGGSGSRRGAVRGGSVEGDAPGPGGPGTGAGPGCLLLLEGADAFPRWRQEPREPDVCHRTSGRQPRTPGPNPGCCLVL